MGHPHGKAKGYYLCLKLAKWCAALWVLIVLEFVRSEGSKKTGRWCCTRLQTPETLSWEVLFVLAHAPLQQVQTEEAEVTHCSQTSLPASRRAVAVSSPSERDATPRTGSRGCYRSVWARTKSTPHDKVSGVWSFVQHHRPVFFGPSLRINSSTMSTHSAAHHFAHLRQR